MLKKYSIKKSLNMISERSLYYNADRNMEYLDRFIKNEIDELSELEVVIKNDSEYNNLDLREILLLCSLLEDVKKINDESLNETKNIKKSIKNEFNFLFEQKVDKSFSIADFAIHLMYLAENTSKEPGEVVNQLYTCNYFSMRTNQNNNILIHIKENFKDLVDDSIFFKTSAGLYFEDLLLSYYANSTSFNENVIKQKTAYIVEIILGYTKSSMMKLSTLLERMTDTEFERISYHKMIKKHSSKIIGLPNKIKLAKTIFNSTDLKIIDANTLQNNCGFDFLLHNIEKKACIIDLKVHHKKSSASFMHNKVSNSIKHFLNSILKIVNSNEENKELVFNIIGLFKLSYDITNSNIIIDKFEIRYDNINQFVNSLKIEDIYKSYKLCNDYSTVRYYDSITAVSAIQDFKKLNIENIYREAVNRFIVNSQKFFTFDEATKDVIIHPGDIFFESQNARQEFVKNIKIFLSSSVIKDYEFTSIFKDENKIKIINEFTVKGKEKFKFPRGSDESYYFHNSTLILTLLNNLSLEDKNNPVFQEILDLAKKVKISASKKRNSITARDAVAIRASIESLLTNL